MEAAGSDAQMNHLNTAMETNCAFVAMSVAVVVVVLKKKKALVSSGGGEKVKDAAIQNVIT